MSKQPTPIPPVIKAAFDNACRRFKLAAPITLDDAEYVFKIVRDAVPHGVGYGVEVFHEGESKLVIQLIEGSTVRLTHELQAE